MAHRVNGFYGQLEYQKRMEELHDLLERRCRSEAGKGNDGKSHYAIVKVSLVLNKKSDNYGTYNQEFLANQDETIKNDVIQVIGQYTLDEFEANKEQVKSEILSDMQKLFGADLVIGVNFSESTSE